MESHVDAALLRTSSGKYTTSSVLACLPSVETRDTYFAAGRWERLIQQA